MSAHLRVYINYMANWTSGTDEQIQTLIDEQKLFKSLGDFDSDSAIDEEFSTLVSLAREVEAETIAADVVQIAADAAAVASFWSFGISMIAFASLEATHAILEKVISSKSADLNNKLKTVDTDISNKISPKVFEYITAYKKNNNLISSQCPKGLNLQESRANLMQFMAQVDKKLGSKGGLTVENFKKLANSARLAFESEEIIKVYEALDELNLSNKSKDDLKKLMNTIKGFHLPYEFIVTVIQGLSIFVVFKKMNVAIDEIKGAAEAENIPPEEFETSAFEMMDAVGKFAVVVAVAMSVIDVIMDVIDIVNVVEQTNAMVKRLDDKIKPSYKSFFNGIKTSAKAYSKAISSKK